MMKKWLVYRINKNLETECENKKFRCIQYLYNHYLFIPQKLCYDEKNYIKITIPNDVYFTLPFFYEGCELDGYHSRLELYEIKQALEGINVIK